MVPYLVFAAFAFGARDLPAGGRAAVLNAPVDGVRVVVMAPSARQTPDVEIVSPAEAKRRLRDAYSLLRERSPFSARGIDRLRAAGEVFLIYDPAFPRKEFSTLTIAAFIPDYFVDAGPRHPFPVVIGRYGIHWPAADLAGALAHELIGHGLQDLDGKLDRRRNLELECEAWLYQEKAHQDLGVDKFRSDLIDFRRQLETIWCADFRSYQKKHAPAETALWDRLNPDVDGLLRGLDRFNEHLRRTGVLSRVRAARERERGDAPRGR